MKSTFSLIMSISDIINFSFLANVFFRFAISFTVAIYRSLVEVKLSPWSTSLSWEEDFVINSWLSVTIILSSISKEEVVRFH